jgi:hypothetical protein
MTWMDAPKECALNSIRPRQSKGAIAEDYKRIRLCHVLNSKLKEGGGKKIVRVTGFLNGEIDQPTAKFFDYVSDRLLFLSS